MKQDLLAPPKITPRGYLLAISAVWILLGGLGMMLVAVGSVGLAQFAWRLTVVVMIGAAMVAVHSWLMARAKTLAPERMPPIHAARGAITFGGVLVAAGVMLRGTVFGNSFVGMLWQVPFVFGLTLATGGWGRRVGESLHCPRCEYEFRFDHPEDAPVRCPECGTGWLGLLKKGRRVRSARLMGMGAAVAFLGGLLMQPIFYMGWLAPHLPTPLLFASLYAFPKTWHSAWDELAARPLDAWSVGVMAQRVLSYRHADQFETSPSRWFESAAAAGKVPPELVERFYREGMEAELAVPLRVKAGEEFTAAVRVRRLSRGAGVQMGVYFAGYEVDGGPPIGRSDKTHWGHELGSRPLSGPRDVLAQKLKSERTGDVPIRAVYWVVYQPSFMEQLLWQKDGTPARPANALWFQRVELEKTVRVE